MVATGGRFEWMTDAKGLAILAVVIYHAFIIAAASPFPHGDMGVDVFVLLSGFGLALSRRAESLGTFYLRRLLNIGPRYWVCLIVFAGLFEAFGIGYTTWPQFFVLAAFGNLIVNTIAGAWWFMSLIVVLYLLYGLVRPVVARGDVGGILAIGLALELGFCYVLGLIFGTSPNGVPSNAFGLYGYVGYRLVEFFLGIAFAIVLQRRSVYSPWTLLASALLAFVWFYRVTTADVWQLIYPAGGFVLLAAFVGFSKSMRSLAPRTAGFTLTFFGTYSYEIYLIHHPLMQYVNNWAWHVAGVAVPTQFEISLGMVLAFAITLPAAAALGRVDALTAGLRDRTVAAID